MKIKKIKRCILFSFLILCFSNICFAEDKYLNKELIPGQEEGTDDFVEYLNTWYEFAIGIAAFLAIFMITLGAFSYIVTSAGNVAKMADAKEMIFNAIYGLILAMLAYLILSLINVDLVKGRIRSVPSVSFHLEDVVLEKV